MVFRWVLSHCDISGNELADTATKQAARQLLHANPPAATKDVSCSIRSKLTAKVKSSGDDAVTKEFT